MSVDQYIKIIEIISWPIVVLISIGLFFKQLLRLFNALLHRIEAGAEFTTPLASFGKVPTTVEEPKENDPITDNNMALIHSSWRYPKKDREYGRLMYCFNAIIQAPEKVLDRIEYVKYHLHPSYPNKTQVINDRKNQFKLKELAWGESNLKAEVKVKDQNDLICLSRYINLNKSGPRIP